jgi:hypothetical protein
MKINLHTASYLHARDAYTHTHAVAHTDTHTHTHTHQLAAELISGFKQKKDEHPVSIEANRQARSWFFFSLSNCMH